MELQVMYILIFLNLRLLLMKHKSLVNIVVFFSIISLVYPQESSINTKYGIYAAFNINQHIANFQRLPGVPNCCPHFVSGSGTGFTSGVLVEYPLTDMFLLGLRAGYTTLNGLLTQNEATTVITNGVPEDGEFVHKMDAAISNIGVEALFGLRLAKNLDRKSVV